MDQTFQRPNKVRILFGHPYWENKDGKLVTKDIRPELVGEEAVILGSYGDLYGNYDRESYSLMLLSDGNSISWFSPKQLELIDAGNEDLIINAKKK